MEYNCIIRAYEGDPADDSVVAELGFTLDSIEKTTQFFGMAKATLEKMGGNPSYQTYTECSCCGAELSKEERGHEHCFPCQKGNCERCANESG